MNIERGAQVSLTGRDTPSTLEKGAFLFMADVGNTEVSKATPPPDSRRIVSVSPRELRTPQLARKLESLDELTQKKPLSDWSSNDLVTQSASWRMLQKADPTNPEIVEVANDVSAKLALEAIRRNLDPLKYTQDVLVASGVKPEDLPANLSETVELQLREFNAEGKLTESELEKSIGLIGTKKTESQIEGINAQISPEEFQEALAKGGNAVRELMDRKGVSEGGSEDFVPLAYQLRTAERYHFEYKKFEDWIKQKIADNDISDFTRRYGEEILTMEAEDSVTREGLKNVGRKIEKCMADRTLTPAARAELEEVLEYLEKFEKDAPPGGKAERTARLGGALGVQTDELMRSVGRYKKTGTIDEPDFRNILEAMRDDLRDGGWEIGDLDGLITDEHGVDIYTRFSSITGTPSDVGRERIKLLEEVYHQLANRLVDQIDPAGQVRDELFEAVSGDTQASRKLIIKIISAPLEDKTQQYHLGFYRQNNLDVVKQALIDRTEEAKEYFEHIKHHNPTETERINNAYKDYQGKEQFLRHMALLVEGVSHAHNLHTILMKSDLQDFGRYSGQLTGSHLNAIFGEKGVSILNRLIEEQFDYSLAVDSGITTLTNRIQDPNSSDMLIEPGSYDRMFGYRDNDGKWNEGTISELYEGIVSLGSGMGLGSEYELEGYQKKFAKDMARYIYALTLRAPEKISFTEFPQGDRESVTRLPMNRVSSMFNMAALTVERWELGKTRGGQKLLELVMRNYNRQRDVTGWNTPMLSRLRGISVERMEEAKLTGSQGFDRSWRQYLVYYRNSPFINPESNGRDSIGSFLASRGKLIKDAAHHHGHGHHSPQEILRDTFLDGHGNLLPAFSHSYGLLLQEPLLNPKEISRLNYGKAYTDQVLQIRAAVFRQAAIDNPLAMATMINKAEVFGDFRGLSGRDLTAAEFAWKEATVGKSGAEITAMEARRQHLINLIEPGADKGNHAVDLKGRDKEAWSGEVVDGARRGGLELKLTMAQEIRQQRIREIFESSTRPWPPTPTIDSILASDERLQLTVNEQELLNRIRHIGSELSPELGTVRFPSTPFMNDVLYENANFAGAGEEAFKDTFSEIATYSEVQSQFIDVIVSPGDKKLEDVYATFAKMVNELGDPLSADDAQDLLYPFVIAYCDMIWKGGLAKELGKGTWAQFWEQDNVISFIREKEKLPSSIVQAYIGNKGHSLGFEEMYDFNKHLLETGTLRKAMYETDKMMDDLGYTSTTHREITRIKGIMRKIPILGRTIEEEHPHLYLHTDLWKKTKKRFWQEGRRGFMLRTSSKLVNVLKLGLLALLFETLSEGSKTS